MSRLLSKTLCLLLSVVLFCSLFPAVLAETASAAGENAADFVPEDLTSEELALWESWSNGSPEEEEADAQNAEALAPEEEAALSELESVINENQPMDEVDLTNLEPNGLLPGNVFNILLLGVDNRSTDLERGLSDAVIICSVNLDTGNVKLTSIARDTAVIVPGFKSKNRINVAYKRGGPELSMKTVNRNFDMNIQRYVVVNIHGLADIIDSLGGVDISMTSKEAGRINYELRKEPMDKVKRQKVEAADGVHHLDGMQAVTFARIRGIDSDLERTRRQRQLLEVLMSTVMKDMDIAKFISLVETALPYGETNLTLTELLQLGTAVLGGEAMKNLQNGGEIMEQLRIPVDKRFGYKEFNGASLIYLSDRNLKFSIETIHNFIYGATYLED
ncbi:MAG: LCP family protein [Candidatus Limiplasma sp.]|nr:LCP family protein [Candidatus Limiplasma sp.]